MKKIKLVGVKYNYDYASDDTIRTFSEELAWTDISDEDYLRLSDAVYHKHKLEEKDPFKGMAIVILQDLSKEPLNLEKFLDEVDEVLAKERIAQKKREETARRAKELKDQKTAERKRKMLEKLKAELEGSGG